MTESSPADPAIAADCFPLGGPATVPSAPHLHIAALLETERKLWHTIHELRDEAYASFVAELERNTAPHHLDAVDRYETAVVSYTDNIRAVRVALWPPPRSHASRMWPEPTCPWE